MKRISLSLLLILTLALFGHLLQRACEAAGIPFLTITVVRDLLLLVLFVWTVKSVPLLESGWLNTLLLLFTLFSAAYLFISAFEDSFLLGLYYLRLYVLPVMFFVTAKIAMQSLDPAAVKVLLRSLLIINVLMLVTAFALYLVILLFPQERPLIFGTNLLPYTWFAAGEGSTLMRMGLPMTSPNHLGVYFGLMLLLFLSLALVNSDVRPLRTTYAIVVALNMAGLAGTFSRSSVLMVVVAIVALVALVPAMRSRKMVMRGLMVGAVLVMAMLGALAVVEGVSDGFVTRWLTLNLRAQDPSLIGHWQSLVDAYDNFERYCWYGYPRGTVGPRAFLFYVNDRFNVENSVVSAVYDLGVVGAAVLFYGYYRMMAAGYQGRPQLALAAGFLVCVQLLPYLFEPVILSLFLFVYLLFGQLERLGYFGAWRPKAVAQVRVGRHALSTGW